MRTINKLKGPLLLTLTALIWGLAFVAQSVGMDYIKPFTFLASRSFVGGIVLLPLIAFMGRKKPKENTAVEPDGRMWLKGGIVCGIFLFAASACQQIGIQYTTAGEAGFMTALYIVIVPLLGIFMGKRAGLKIWLAVAVALIGAYLLSVKENFTISVGIWWLLGCSVLFSFHILVCDKYGSVSDPVKISCVQFFTCGVLSLVFTFVMETPTWETILDAWIPILYCGCMSSGVAYTLQIVGQKYTQPTVASLVMSLESVFSAVFGWIILSQALNLKEISGCVLVFAAVIIAQLPQRTKSSAKKT